MSDDFNVMLAKNYDPKRVQSWKEMYVEPKLDGVRVIVQLMKAGAPKYFSRNGRELGMFTHLDPSIVKLRNRLKFVKGTSTGLMLDTEAVGMTFGDVSGAIHTKGTVALTCRLHVFHMMPWQCFERGNDSMTQADRAEQLQFALDSTPIKGITIARPARVLDHAQVMKAHRFYRSEDYEGTMVKNLHVAWTAKRTWAWMKIKEEQTVEVEVTGIKEGKGKYAGMCGALICDHKGRKVQAGGMTDEQREMFFNKPKSIVGKMIEVTYQEETAAGSLRHIRFKRVRDDKG